jgi:hypothetical protein
MKSEARYQLKRAKIDYYELTITNEDLGNPLNIGSKMDIIPHYSNLQFMGFISLHPQTVAFVEDSMVFLKQYPDLVKNPENIKGKEKIHRIGPGELYLTCNLCYSPKLIWVDQGWYCPECGNEKDFSLALF